MPKTTTNNANRPTVLEVSLENTVVGTLTNLPNDQNLFFFDSAYIAATDRPVLSLSFYDAYRQLVTNVRPVTRKLPPFFSNLLPKGQLRQYIAEHGEINAQREFFLLWLLGDDLPGAVKVRDVEGRTLSPTEKNPTTVRTRAGKRVLRSFLFEVQPGDPATFVVVGALFVGVGLLACWAPARRAGKVDPLEALSYE